MTGDKVDELKIEGKGDSKEAGEASEAERVTPDVEADFLGLLKDYGVAEKAAKIITKHIADTGSPDIFDDPRELLGKMAKFPRHVPPVTRKNILDHWVSTRNIPIPEGFEEEADLSAEELKTRKGKGTAPEKYSIDTDTGAIKVASTTDKTALTWDEAEKLSREIKKDIEAREKREDVGKEPAFVVGEHGAWTLNPKAPIGFGEFAVFQMYQDSLKRGEPIDPVEELTKREEQSARLKEAMGVKTGGEDTEMTMLDKLDKLGMLKKGEGEGGLLAQLDSLGLLRKSGEEGRDTQIDMLSQLDQLGLLRKTGEEGGSSQIAMLSQLDQLGLLKKPGEGEGSQTILALQTEVKELRESLQKQEMDNIKNVMVSLSNQLGELRKEMSNQGKLEGRYALMDKTISTIDSQLSGIRSDVKPLVMAAGGGTSEPRKKSPEEKAKIAKGLKEAVVLEKEARQLEDELLFGGGSQG